MSIPVGTTARGLEAIGRWMLAVVVIVGMGSWWLPGYRTWAALTIGVLVVWTLWLCRQTVLADRSVPWHPAYLILAVPAGILVYHTARDGMGTGSIGDKALAGTLDASMVFHLWLLASGIMVTQSLLPRAAKHAAVLSLCGAAMMGGAVLAVVLGPDEKLRGALGCVAFAGVAVWLTPLWPASASQMGKAYPLAGGALRLAVMLAAAVATGILAWFVPLTAIICLCGVAGSLVLAGIIFRRGRWALLAIGGGLGLVAVLTLLAWPRWPEAGLLASGPIGRGEQAIVDMPAGMPGLTMLAGTIGWVGLGWLAAVAGITAGYMMFRIRSAGEGQQARAILWTTAAALAGAGLLAGGGPSIPSVTLAVAFTWGLLPSMLSGPVRRVSGGWVLLALAGLLGLLAFSRHSGMVSSIALAVGGGDITMHVCAGFFLSMVLAWLMGARRIALGLAGIAIIAAAGGVAELLQGVLSKRSVQVTDWIGHLVGCGMAAPLYLLCVTSRWCESPDAKAAPVKTEE